MPSTTKGYPGRSDRGRHKARSKGDRFTVHVFTTRLPLATPINHYNAAMAWIDATGRPDCEAVLAARVPSPHQDEGRPRSICLMHVPGVGIGLLIAQPPTHDFAGQVWTAPLLETRSREAALAAWDEALPSFFKDTTHPPSDPAGTVLGMLRAGLSERWHGGDALVPNPWDVVPDLTTTVVAT